MAENEEKNKLSGVDNLVDREIYGVEDNYSNSNRDNEIAEKIKKIKVGSTNNTDQKDILDLFNRVQMNRSARKSKVARQALDQSKKNIENNITDLFQNEVFNNEQQRISRYEDFRIIDMYIPEIAVSLDVLTDSIMSPDDITKDSMLFYYADASTNDKKNTKFDSNMKKLFKKYKLDTKIHDAIREGLLLGDQFIMTGRISDQFNKYINDGILNESNDLSENFNFDKDTLDSFYNSNIKIINEYVDEELSKNETEKLSDEEYKKRYIKQTVDELKSAINGNVNYYKDPSKLLTDYGKSKSKSKLDKYIDIKGLYFKFLNPDDVVKLEIDGECIGYIYIERSQLQSGNGFSNTLGGSGSLLKTMTSYMASDGSSSSTTTTTSGITDTGVNNSPSSSGNTALEYEGLIDLLVSGLSKKIDKEFIEDNIEFKDTILRLVKQDYIIDKQISITYLPPEEVTHIKLDSNNTYGTSRLQKSLFAAKLYLSTQITNLMVKINQGRDRRVFYVDSDMDADYESNIQDLIRDIRSKEISSDMLGNGKSISTTLRTIGSLENFYIPRINGKFCPSLQ